jgi:hypothetical protein
MKERCGEFLKKLQWIPGAAARKQRHGKTVFKKRAAEPIGEET